LRRAAVLSALLALATATPPAAGAETAHLCEAGETVWLAARTMESGDLLSLCGVRDPADKASWLQFRLRRPGVAELRVPADTVRSVQAFTIRRYTRPRTTYLKLEIAGAGHRYVILEDFEADRTPPYGAWLRIVNAADGATVSSEKLRMLTEPLNMMRLELFVLSEPYNE